MAPDVSLWTFIADAGLVVKIVMLLLLAASVLSWTFIFQHGLFIKKAKVSVVNFEERFWSGRDLSKLYDGLKRKGELDGMESIFYSGFREYTRMNQRPGVNTEALMASVERSMRVAQSRATEQLERHLPFLATAGSVSPYVGLFGTVWGIMTSLQALGSVQQATIAMVAPGISEALIATAMGLFVAIPAVIAYNRFNNEVERLGSAYDTFQEEFTGILHRQAHFQLQESVHVRETA